MAKDISHAIEFVLSEEDLVWIRKEYGILESIRLELQVPV